VGGVSAATRRAAVHALRMVFDKAAPALGATPDRLEAVDGHIRVQGEPGHKLTWRQAAALFGRTPVTAPGPTRRRPIPGSPS